MPGFEVAGGIIFEIWLVAAQPILADLGFAGAEVRNNDAGVVSAPSADNLATGQRIDSSDPSKISQGVPMSLRLAAGLTEGDENRR